MDYRQNAMKKLLPKLIVLIVIAAAIGVSLYFYFQYQQTQKLLQNPTLVSEEQTKALLAQVSKIVELPKGENPTIATVSDKSKLANQAFFANSQNGDKVLIFTKAGKAILYRPSVNKIIEMAPINNMSGQAVTAPLPTTSISVTPSAIATPSPTIAQVVTVAIYNGTKTAGLATTYETQLTSKIKELQVVKKSDAKGDYTSNLVVDLTSQNTEIAKQIATLIGGTVGALPKAEVKPDTDILVIVGK